MSARRASAALIEFDCDTADAVRTLFEDRDPAQVSRQEKAAVLEQLAGTWTLGLAAKAAGLSEKDVLTAFARDHLRCALREAIALVDAI